MSVRTDVVNLIVNVGGDKAQNELNKLRKTSAELNAEMKGLNKNTTEYKQKAAQLKDVENQMVGLRKQIGLTALSQKELTAELNRLKQLKNIAVPQSEEFKRLQKEIDAVTHRLGDVKSGMFGFKSTLNSIGKEVKQFGMLAIGYLGFEFVTDSFKKIIANGGKVSDQMADLQRVTGMTGQEAKNLNTQLLALNSRTSGDGLRSIAIIAGKLGVAKDDLLAFTKAVDMLVISLGDELGDADQITSQLGKILNVFDGKVTGKNITELGNAMVVLANNGVATGSFIADFAQRVSGIAKASDMSLGATVGLAAGFEELGLRSESSSTALQKLLSTIAGDIPKAAKIAGMPLAEFNKLFSEQPQEALIKYAEGLVKNKKSFSEITAGFKDAGEEGARVVQTLQAIGQRGDFLRQKITLGSDALKESTAITNAFNLKNETLGATLDKIGKKIASAFSSSSFLSNIKSMANGLAWLVGATDKASESLADFYGQQSMVNDLEKSMVPLISRYEELNGKATQLGGITNLSTAEQVELNKAIQTIANGIPYAITQFDKYGNVIGISTQKAREFIEIQQLILKEKNRETIDDQKQTLATLEKQLKTSVMQFEQVQRAGANYGVNNTITKGIEELSGKVATLKQRIMGVKGLIAELSGDKLSDALKPKTDTTGTATTPTETLSETEIEAAAKKAARAQDRANDQCLAKLKSLNDKIIDLKNDLKLALLTDDEKEVERIKIKYEKLISEAVGYASHIVELKALEQEELKNVEVLSYRKREEELQKYIDNLNNKWAEADKKTADDNAKGTLARTLAYFKKLIATNEKNAQDETKRIEQNELDKTQLKIQALEQFMNQVIGMLSQAANYADAVENAELQKYLNANEQKKKSFDQLLNSKRISQTEHDKRIAELDKKNEERKREIDIKQFKRRQAIAYVSAIINAAEGVTKIWATYGAMPYVAAALTAVQAIVTGLEIATISKQKPPTGRKGLVVQGPSHEAGGIDMVDKSSGSTLANIEGGEPVMVLSKNTYGNNKDVIDNLIYNSNHRNGAPIAPRWLTSTPSINPSLIPQMARGGVVSSTANQMQASYGNIEQLMATMLANQQAQTNLLSQWPTRIKADVVLQEFKEAETLLSDIKKESGLNQS